MHYRTLNVNGTDYRYVIGRKFIHIRGLGRFLISEHGNAVAHPCNEIDGVPLPYRRYIATPATVRALILGKETPVYVSPGNKLLMVNPFEAEIYDRVVYIPYSRAAHASLSDDI